MACFSSEALNKTWAVIGPWMWAANEDLFGRVPKGETTR